MKKHFILITGLSTAVIVIAATLYAFFAIQGKTVVTIPIFVLWLAVLMIFSAAFIYTLWQERQKFNIGKQILILLWGCVAIWYWWFAPFYTLLTVHLNNLQTAWTMFNYFWEVTLIGGVMFVLISYVWFRPFQKYLEKKEKPADPERLYRQALQYPLKVGVWVGVASMMGYIFGGLQHRFFSGMPLIEQINNDVTGVAVSIFLGIILYLLLDSFFISRVREQFEKDYPSLNLSRRKLTLKAVGISLGLVAGTLILLTLVIFTAFQGMVRESVALRMGDLIPEISERFKNAVDENDRQTALEAFRYGKKGTVIVLPEDRLNAFEEIAPETRRFIATHPLGSIQDLNKEIKLVSFFKDESNNVVISLVELPEFYLLFLQSMAPSFWAIIFVVTLTVIVSIFMNTMLTRSIRLLSARVQKIRPGTEQPQIEIYTGDEIESLSHTLSNYIKGEKDVERTKNEFLLLASHQLRTPPTTIKWSAERLLKNQKTPLTPAQKELVERIFRNNQRVIDLATTFLDISQIELGVFTIEPVPTDLASIIKSLLDEFKLELTERHITAEEIYVKNIPLLLVDQKLLRIVLHNLIANAIYYSPAGGSIRVEIGNHPGKETVGGRFLGQESVVIAVTDNGYGIPKEAREKIFTKFFRAGNAKVYTRGTGLGLYMSKLILDRSGGSIWFESPALSRIEGEENKGTTFYVSIPLSGMKQTSSFNSP